MLMLLGVMPKAITLYEGDTLLLGNFPRWGFFKNRGVVCKVEEGNAVELRGDTLIAKSVGISIILCGKGEIERGFVIRVVPKGFERPEPIFLRVGERVKLLKFGFPEELKVYFLVKPPWLARVIGDSLEGLSEGRGILQVHIVKGDRILDEFPIPLVVEGKSKVYISPKMVVLRVGEATKFSISGDYISADWQILPKGVGDISGDGVFTALKPGKAVIIAKVRLKDGSVASAKAFVRVLKRP